MKKLLVAVSLISLIGCARNPVTGRREIVLISQGQELAMGRDNHPGILQEYGRVDNDSIQNYIQRIGKEFAEVSHRPELDWQFTVVDSPVVNAFAVPGGYVYFTRGILAHMNSEAELAGVMGHEIGHVTARHSVQQMTRTQLAQIGLAVGSIASPTIGQFGCAAQSALGLLFLRYGRDDERESDQLGVEYSARGGYDPRQVSSFFQVLARLSAGAGPALPPWLSTHPDPGERVATTRALGNEQIQQLGLLEDDLRVNRETHIRILEGMVYGNNPREGFTEDGRFYHPDLRFELMFPLDWEVQNTRSAVYASEAGQQAQMQLRLADAPEGSTVREFVQQLADGGSAPESGRYRTINGNPAFVGVYNISDAGGTLSVLVGFIDFGGQIYQIVGAANALNVFGDIMEDSILSFDRLEDLRILNVQPDRLTIYTARGGDSLERLAEEMTNARVDAETLSILNRLPLEASIPAGTLVKLVEPGY